MKKVFGEHFKVFGRFVRNELYMKGVYNQFNYEHKREIFNK